MKLSRGAPLFNASVFAAPALSVALALGAVPAQAADVSYFGVAALCAIEPPSSVETRGSITLTHEMPMIFRIETNSALVTGWERLLSSSRLNRKDKGLYWGYGTVTPDSYSGTLEGDFRFRSKDMAYVTGTYYGTGELTGVVMHYELVPIPFDPNDPICGGVPPMGGYAISGTLENMP